MSVPQVARKIVTAIPGPKSQALEEEHHRYVSAGVGQGMPVFAETASGSTITDVDGNRFIDLASGIAVTGVGNCAPEVVAAVQEEVAKLTHTNFATTPYANYVEVCKKLAEHTPGDFAKKSVLVNSGAEAVENAIKIARKYTGRSAVVVMENAFHGRTNLTMAMTTKSMPYKQGMGAIMENVVAQELHAHGFDLYYFNTNRLGEVDFMVQSGRIVLPVEVKSGNDWTKRKVLDNVLAVDDWALNKAYVLCKGNVRQDGRITYLPLYMSMFLEPERRPESMIFDLDLSALRQ